MPSALPSSRILHEPSPTPSKRSRRVPSPPPRIQTPSIIPLHRHPSPPPRIPTPPPRRHLSTPVHEINVLLLGETGVGKSTFINAFVNYLKFDTLQLAERGEPVVLIPVSFLITVGDQFDEFKVTFGKVDANEDHEHQGQSVTQQCKSYVFDLNNQTRLRIIDTPGIGDTRGIVQDEKNIHHILTYINTLPHLHAVCLLLKPNASKLNVFFRSCVNQLLTYITPVGYNNIIFCFTNARATFFAPGDTGPLLRKMLHDERLSDIPFKKENTFCFDSESFRYLAARKRGIEFDDFQKHECTTSWTTSVTESVRLLNFIRTREPYDLQNWQSPKKLALDISMLARPLMETLRLILYNWKSRESGLVGNQIVIKSSPVTTDICSNCAQSDIVEVAQIWVTRYQPGPLKSNVTQHRQCPSNGRHFLIEAIVEYASVAEPAGLTAERWQNSFHSFLLKCDRLTHFLRQQGPAAQNDPFQPILDRFLDEEQQISQFREINTTVNRRVHTVLRSLKQTRQQNSQQLLASHEQLALRQVNQIIDELIAIPTVDKQIQSIKASRQLKMQAHEHRVPANFIKNHIFAERATNGYE
jgi:GTP-binding protein EngB required for normal cell division